MSLLDLVSVPEGSTTGKARVARTHFFRLIHALEVTAEVSYILDDKYRFVYTNPAWDRFARLNGAPKLTGDAVTGAALFDAIPEVLRGFYGDAFQRVKTERGVWDQLYECSSPERFRQYRMRIHFMAGRSWFLVTNALVSRRPHAHPSKPDVDVYMRHGVVIMCAHCRCSKRIDRPNQWDFVQEHLRFKGIELLAVSHALCPICQAYFYPNSPKMHRTAKSRRA
jgi:hypothetical protein